MNTDIQRFQDFALKIVDATRAVILEFWRDGKFGEVQKEDNTPVTEVDLKAEKLAREMIIREFPQHGIIGEEYESINPDSEFQWTIDPIDGTQNLINLIPTFGTLIGLRYRGEAVMGIIDHPVLNYRTYGGRGLGVCHNGSKIHLNDIPGDIISPNDLVATNSLAVFDRGIEGTELFNRTMSFHPHSRIYYDCYAHTLAVLGCVAVVVEPNLKIWDITPVEALLKELNGGYVKFGERAYSESTSLINSVFGKRGAVKLMCKHLGI